MAEFLRWLRERKEPDEDLAVVVEAPGADQPAAALEALAAVEEFRALALEPTTIRKRSRKIRAALACRCHSFR